MLLFTFLLFNSHSFIYKREHKKFLLNSQIDELDHGEVKWEIDDNYSNYNIEKYNMNKKNIYIKYIEQKKKNENNSKEQYNPIISGIIKIIHKEYANVNEILLEIQDLVYLKNDSNYDITNEIYIALFNYILKLRYENYNLKENQNISKLNLNKKNNYIKIKKITSYIMLIIFTILCRNVHYAE